MGRPRDPDGLRGIARRLGVSSAAVSKAARTGRIDLSAPVEEIARQWEANTDPAMQRVRSPGRSSAAIAYARERARLVKAQADKQEIENAVSRGELLRADEVRKTEEVIFIALRDRVMAVQSVATVMSDLAVAGKPGEARALLRQALRDALEEVGTAELVSLQGKRRLTVATASPRRLAAGVAACLPTCFNASYP